MNFAVASRHRALRRTRQPPLQLLLRPRTLPHQDPYLVDLVSFYHNLTVRKRSGTMSAPAPQVASAPTAVIEQTPSDESVSIKNISGATAGAGSGEFHTYRMAKRREQMRIERLKEMTEEQRAEMEFQLQKKKREEEFESKHESNVKKRKKKKEKEKQKREQAKKKRKTGEADGQSVNVGESAEESEDEKGDIAAAAASTESAEAK
eukprot:TRINITY_DN2601_c0_g1_i1.p1 TRINITY_DN2601_c0_g1~~TRINITY_DN2601_c0_g1_i1.p1  ORF type:complete len:206 (-),score=53.11 TRINITY_DN2601_c0_g1_i1:53-670(-)